MKDGCASDVKLRLQQFVQLGVIKEILNHQDHEGQYKGQQAIHIACRKGSFSIVKEMVKEDPNIVFSKTYCCTPLWLAKNYKHKPIIDFLKDELNVKE